MITSDDQALFELIVDIMFFVDICMNFITGYIDKNNRLIMDPKSIALRYTSYFNLIILKRSWFVVDVIATLPFELITNIFNNEAGNSSGLFSILKLPRLLR